jgi:hypothetical protein
MLSVTIALPQVNSIYPGYKPNGLLGRFTTKSNYYTAIFNDGFIGDNQRSTIPLTINGHWPRSMELMGVGSTIQFFCVKDGRKLVSGQTTRGYDKPNWGPFTYNQFVPGCIGDQNGTIDTAFGGIGWKYQEDLNDIVYVSTDYNAEGVDISGNNFYDWPIRLVNGKETYVRNVLERSQYPPIFKSEEDFFCVFKDTETDADPEYNGPSAHPDTFSVPIGIEVRLYFYTWSKPLLRDVVVAVYEIVNKSGKTLDESFIFSNISGNSFYWPFMPSNLLHRYSYFPGSPKQSMTYYNIDANLPEAYANEYLPFVGKCYLQTPLSVNNTELGLSVWKDITAPSRLEKYRSDRYRYDYAVKLPYIYPNYVHPSNRPDTMSSYTMGTGPFRMLPGETVRLATAGIVANGFDQLAGMRRIIQRMYDNNMTVPPAPTQPKFSVAQAADGVVIRWDSAAESSVDPIIDDSIGRSFAGYRLYRATAKNGPYIKIKEWTVGRDSLIHEYVDRGTDRADTLLNGLLLNKSYYYKVTAFDEGIPSIDFPASESVAEAVTIIPSGTASSPYDLENIRIVPNPFVVTHAAQLSIDRPAVFFNYLPDECTIRIYTTALELVAELHHSGGSRAEWNLRTQGGQQVASQLLIAKISTPQGTSIIKKFAVVFAE